MSGLADTGADRSLNHAKERRGDAVLRTMQAADIAGIRAMGVHAISEDAKRFYERCGFQPSPADPMTLMITMRDAQRVLIGENET